MRGYQRWLCRGLLLGFLLGPGVAMAACTPGQLAHELQSDPMALGYAPLIAAGHDADLLALLIEVRDGPNFLVTLPSVTGAQVLARLDPTEFVALADEVRREVLVRLAALITLAQGPLPITKASVKALLLHLVSVFPDGGPTRTAMQHVDQRQGSRHEVVCGVERPLTLSVLACALRPESCS
jgi:hypothetical protein